MTTPFPFVANTVLTAAQLNAITTLPISAQTASYTLVVGDVGKRVQMTNASATTITVNTGIFAAGDTIWIQNMGAGTCTITSGTCTVSTASSLALAQYGGGTLVFQSASAATFFSQQASTYGVATGGTSSSITVSGVNYTLLSFSSDNTLVVSKAGLFDCLIIGGGGGGGSTGGAGAGGVYQGTIYLAAASHSVKVGAGGSAKTNGITSYVGTAAFGIGGGFGSSAPAGDPFMGYGGSGGGAWGAASYGLGVTGQGNNGGTASATGGGGGGGQSAVGGNAGANGGNGAVGLSLSTFTGGTNTTLVAGGGGGGGNTTGGTASYGGGKGSDNTSAPGAGTANTGGGGGGQFNAANAAAGGSGLVLVRFK